MKLTEKQIKEIVDKFLKLKIKCPACNHHEIGVSDILFEIREFEKGTLKLGGNMIPLVVTVCRRCGFTSIFNAIVLGILPKNGDESNGGKNKNPKG